MEPGGELPPGLLFYMQTIAPVSCVAASRYTSLCANGTLFLQPA